MEKKYKTLLRRLLNYYPIMVTNTVLLIVGVVLIFTTAPSPLSDLGISLAGSGIVGLFSLYVVKVREALREQKEQLREWGLRGIYANRSDKSVYEAFLSKCREHLDIQAETLTRFYNDFKELLPVLDQRRVKIRLLMLDPESLQCKMRESEEGSTERRALADRIRDQTAQFLSLGLVNLEVRWYSCTPSVNYFRVDDHAFFGSYFVGIVSRNSLTFLGLVSSNVVRPYAEHFEKVWRDLSRAVSVEHASFKS
jgi:hypothetical protein